MRQALVVGWILLVGCTVALAQNGQASLAVGAKVQIEWAGKPVEGVVVGRTGTGSYRVKFSSAGRENLAVLPPSKVVPLAPAGAAPPAAGAKNEPRKPSANPPAASSPAMAKGVPRTWTDSAGKYKVEARLVEFKDNQVKLERADGIVVALPLERLSEADQKFVKEQAAAPASDNPFEPTAANSSTPGGAPATTVPAATTQPAGPQLTQTDRSNEKHLEMTEPGPWNVKIEGRPPLTKSLSTRPILLGGGQPLPAGFHESFVSLLFIPQQAKACAVTFDKIGKQGIQLHIIDLAAGRSSPPIVFPARIKPVDIDPSGQWLAAHPDIHVGNQGLKGLYEITVCKLSENAVEHVATWNPGRRSPSFAQFVGSQRLLTVCWPAEMVLWEATTAKAVYSATLMNGCHPGISPGHEHLALPLREGLYVVKAQTGETVGKLPWEVEHGHRMFFRPDGKQLAAVGFQRVQVFDLTNGELYRDISLPHGQYASQVDWVADGYLLINGKVLVDLTRRIVLWHYYHEGAHGELGGAFWFALTSQDRKQRGIFRIALPTPDAQAAVARLNPDELLAVRPGMKIALQLNLNGPDEAQRKAQKIITERIATAGLTLAESSPLVLEASTEAGESIDIVYTSVDLDRTQQRVTFTEQISRLRMLENGKVLWQADTKNRAPYFLKLKADQTLEEALQPYQQPNLEFFGGIKIPAYVARPNEQGAFGATRLTAQGPVPAELSIAPRQ